MIIQCPECSFERNVDISKIPATAQLATCPKCKNKFHFRECIVDDQPVEERNSASETSQVTLQNTANDKQTNKPLEYSQKPFDTDAKAEPPYKKTAPAQSELSQSLSTGATEAPDSPDNASVDDVSVKEINGDQQKTAAAKTKDGLPDTLSMASSSTSEKEKLLSIDLPETVESSEKQKELTPLNSDGPIVSSTDEDVPASSPELQEEEPHPVATPQADNLAQPQNSDTNPVTQDISSHSNGDIWDAIAALGKNDSYEQATSYDVQKAENSIPWEQQTGNKGKAFLDTISLILRSPAHAFAGLTANGLVAPFLFFMLLGLLGAIVEQGWMLGLFNVFGEEITQSGFRELVGKVITPDNALNRIIQSIAWLPVKLFGMATIYHILVRIISGKAKTFGITLRVIAYSSATTIATIIPIIGIVGGNLWFLALSVIGIKHAHALSWKQTILALLPFYLLLLAVIAFIFRAVTLPLPV